MTSRYSLLELASEAEYRTVFATEVCREMLQVGELKIYFSPRTFGHAFFESSNRDGVKDEFSPARAQRMLWIREVLTDPTSEWYVGWNKSKKCYDSKRAVCVNCGDFVVVLGVRKWPKMEFMTCYVADNSIGLIKKSPEWTYGLPRR